ncbi:MAG: right-handed parallel beta-helix repeat-containing protein [Myxococcales bacterium]|nr:right-handed parallel beta-helix repeat-containing protein [Myxococcales bacterium]
MYGLVWVAVSGCSDDGRTRETLFVDQAAEEGGDGSESQPLRSVGEALALVRAEGLVYVASGTYQVPERWEFDAPVSILGSLNSSTRFEADQGNRIQWSGVEDVALSIRDVRFDSAFTLTTINLTLRDVEINGAGPALSLANSSALLTDLVVRVSEESGPGEYDDDSVLVQDATVMWTGGAAVDGPDRGLVVERSIMSLSDVEVSSAARSALHIAEGSEFTADAVTIEDAGLAVLIQNSSLSLSRSHIARTTQTSILGGAESIIVIEDSTFEDSPGGFVAMSVGATSLTVLGSSFMRSTSDNCITVNAGIFVATGNTIYTCAGSGISAIGVDVDIRDNDIRNILPDVILGIIASAVSLTAATGTISGNTIVDTMDSGINSIDSVITASSNTIGPIGGAGISHVDSLAEKSTFSDNEIAEATGAGIIMLGGNADATANIITGTKLSSFSNFGDGIVFGSGANASVENNTITTSARSGVLFLNGALGNISGNTSTANGQYGISELCLETPNQVTVGTNTLGENTLGESQLCSL